MDFLKYNSLETLPGYEARATFTVNSSSVFKEDVDIVPTIVDDTLSYIPWDGASCKELSQCIGRSYVEGMENVLCQKFIVTLQSNMAHSHGLTL